MAELSRKWTATALEPYTEVTFTTKGAFRSEGTTSPVAEGDSLRQVGCNAKLSTPRQPLLRTPTAGNCQLTKTGKQP
jgi:hypothetical protein